MTTSPETPKQPWWRKKGRWAAATLAYLVFYFLFFPAAVYITGGRPATEALTELAYLPLAVAVRLGPDVGLAEFLARCVRTGARHREEAGDPPDTTQDIIFYDLRPAGAAAP